MIDLHRYDPVIANVVLRNLPVDDIVLVMRYSSVDTDPKHVEAFTLMLMGLRETCQIRLINYTKF